MQFFKKGKNANFASSSLKKKLQNLRINAKNVRIISFRLNKDKLNVKNVDKN